MAKRVKIPGRLESAETGNIVTGADAVMDDEKGKTQVVINSEVDAAIINLAQGKQDNLTFDSAPTEDSPNPVTSAGVYTADKVLSDAIEAILLLIPSAASALNKLVDMQTMNSSIATATASFKGTYNLVSDLHLGVDATHEQIGAALDALTLGADNNDYAFVQVPNSATAPTEISKTERFKFNGTNWLFEYDLNNSGFTSPQWNAINSGVTSLLVSKLSNLPTNAELTTLLAGKQDNLTFDNVPTAGSPNPVKSGGVYARNNEIVALITALDAAKQDVLTFDNAPVEDSPNPVKSGGVYTAISAVQAAIVALDAAKQNVLTFDSTPTLGSPNPVTSSGIKTEANRLEGLINANAAAIVTLDNLYRALTQSSLVVVAPTDTWPVASPDAYTIYRVVDRVNTPPQYYSDYMFSGSTPVLMAQYDNAMLLNCIRSTDLLFMTAPTSPYNDLNTIPVNSIITYVGAQANGVLHTPTRFRHFTIETKSYRNENSGGLVQVAYNIGSIKGFAIRHNWSGSFSEWEYLNENNYIKSTGVLIQNQSQAVAPYDDFDTLPVNSIVTYVISSQMSIQNTPNFPSMTVKTFNYDNQVIGGVVQVAYRIDGISGLAYRTRWGAQSAYTEWHYFVDEETFKKLEGDAIKSSDKLIQIPAQVVVPYDNIDTLPLNSIVTYVVSDQMQVSNLPPFNQFTVKTFNYTNEVIGGVVQVAYRINGPFGVAYRARYGALAAFNAWEEIAGAKNVTVKPYTSMASFLRIGVIGDSYASGWLNVSGSETDWYNMSWIQQIARRNGISAFNFSKGGLTSRSWLTDATRGLALLNSTDPCDLYYLVLGINDVQTLGTSYLGSISDCPTNLVDPHPDTFYGNMGEIILRIKDKAQRAHIILSTMSFVNGDYATFNEAIMNIANNYSLPVIVQVDDPFFTSNYYNDYKVGGHPTVQLYGGMAMAIERLTNKCMVNNPSYFNDIYPTSNSI